MSPDEIVTAYRFASGYVGPTVRTPRQQVDLGTPAFYWLCNRVRRDATAINSDTPQLGKARQRIFDEQSQLAIRSLIAKDA